MAQKTAKPIRNAQRSALRELMIHLFGHGSWEDITKGRVAVLFLLSLPAGLVSDFCTIFGQRNSLYLSIGFLVIGLLFLALSRRYKCVPHSVVSLTLAFMFGCVFGAEVFSGSPDVGVIASSVETVAQVQLSIASKVDRILETDYAIREVQRQEKLAVDSLVAQGNRNAIILASIAQALGVSALSGDQVAEKALDLLSNGKLSEAVDVIKLYAERLKSGSPQEKDKAFQLFVSAAMTECSVSPVACKTLFQEAAQLKPLDPEAKAGLAMAEFLQGNVAVSALEFSAVMDRLEPDDPMRILGLGAMLTKVATNDTVKRFVSQLEESRTKLLQSSRKSDQYHDMIHFFEIIEVDTYERIAEDGDPKSEGCSRLSREVGIANESQEGSFIVSFIWPAAELSEGEYLQSQGEFDKALDLFTDVETQTIALVQSNPQRYGPLAQLARSYCGEARAYTALNKENLAISKANACVNTFAQITLTEDNLGALAGGILSDRVAGLTNFRFGRFEEASSKFSDLLSILSGGFGQQFAGAVSAQVANARMLFATSLFYSGHVEKAKLELRESLDEATQVLSKGEVNSYVLGTIQSTVALDSRIEAASGSKAAFQSMRRDRLELLRNHRQVGDLGRDIDAAIKFVQAVDFSDQSQLRFGD